LDVTDEMSTNRALLEIVLDLTTQRIASTELALDRILRLNDQDDEDVIAPRVELSDMNDEYREMAEFIERSQANMPKGRVN
jgi:hypothetical protein